MPMALPDARKTTMSDTFSGEYLAKFNYMLDSRWVGDNVHFELWVNRRDRAACVIWAATDGIHYRCDLGPGDMTSLVATHGAPYVGNETWMNFLADITRAFTLAYPAKGTCHPDVLSRSFDKLPAVYRGLERTLATD